MPRPEHPKVPEGLTEKDDDCGESSNDSGVSALVHDMVHNRDREATECGW